MLVIDPEECIDCGACVPACPVEAIFPEDEVPEAWAEYTDLNARLFADWPMIDAQQEPMDCADEFREVEDKRQLLSEEAVG
jgi:ferredoxin